MKEKILALGGLLSAPLGVSVATLIVPQVFVLLTFFLTQSIGPFFTAAFTLIGLVEDTLGGFTPASLFLLL